MNNIIDQMYHLIDESLPMIPLEYKAEKALEATLTAEQWELFEAYQMEAFRNTERSGCSCSVICCRWAGSWAASNDRPAAAQALNRYPSPRRVTTNLGLAGSSSTFSRRRRTATSTARTSPT